MSVSSVVRRSQAMAAARDRLGRLWPSTTGSDDPIAVKERWQFADAHADGLDGGVVAALPETLRRGRLQLDGWGALALVVVAVAGLLLAAWFAWRGHPEVAPATPAAVLSKGSAVEGNGRASPPTGAAPSGASSRPAGSALLVVDVAGRVRRPGLVRLPAGARVADALEAAGGALPGLDLTPLNLAALVTDGEQVVVGVAAGVGAGGAGGVAGAGGGSASGGVGGAGGLLDLNAASLEQLESLPGVGPVLAQRIVDWRTAHGRFADVGELREVGGIGARKFADIQPKVRV